MIAPPPDKVAAILPLLKNAQKSGESWSALCPAHEDSRNSLSISAGDDGRVLLHCHAGCAFRDIAAAMGMKPVELMAGPPPPKSGGRLNIIATYDYQDADGRMLYQVCRCEPKDFRQRRPDGRGGWIWRVKGVPPVPYRLPQLAAAPANQSVIVVEGEKDADRLARLGLIATTNSGGAGEWPTAPEYLEWFRGREVIVLIDNDKSGHEHGAKVAASLQGIAAEVRVVLLPGLPSKGDVSDWLDAGGTVEELQEIVEHSPTWPPDAHRPESPAEESIAVPEQQTELANARRLVKRFRNQLLHVPAWGKWFVWDGRRWADDVGEVRTMQAAKMIADDVWDAVKGCQTDVAIDFAKRTSKHAACRAMINLAASDLAVSHESLDAAPWLLNCPNGTVDLRTGELRGHRPGDFLTKLAPVRFDPVATCPRFEQFLDEVFGSPELVSFMQRLVGYTLTGDVREQVLPICWGTGANGKSTLLTTLQQVLGDYAGQAPGGLLSLRKSEQHPTELAGLVGKRFVVASETEGGCRLAEALVKQLTGGDRITARRMREDFWEFPPTHKLFLATNHKPQVKGTDHGIWRRLLLIPFTATFEGGSKDPELPAKLLTEAEGILAWAVRGCLAWQKEGLQPPPEVVAATQEYRSQEDVVGRFVTECCDIGRDDYCVRFSELYEAMSSWSADCGASLPAKRAVGTWLKERGMKEYRSNGRCYRGVQLKKETE